MSARTRFVIFIVVAAVLAAGVGFAGGVYFQEARFRAVFSPKAGARAALHFKQQMAQELSLTPSQQVVVDSILDRWHRKTMQVMKEGMQRYGAMHDSTVQEIKMVLTEEQRAKYDAWLARLKVKHSPKAPARRTPQK